jgi:hypothetical protein
MTQRAGVQPYHRNGMLAAQVATVVANSSGTPGFLNYLKALFANRERDNPPSSAAFCLILPSDPEGSHVQRSGFGTPRQVT